MFRRLKLPEGVSFASINIPILGEYLIVDKKLISGYEKACMHWIYLLSVLPLAAQDGKEKNAHANNCAVSETLTIPQLIVTAKKIGR
ncbi:hypothetical protein [Parafilimonas sp.]|uniref:hypothetical protein n=1 Tax=Parafilimonas sp. TaxID=1969739 RepID=UPI0039E30083